MTNGSVLATRIQWVLTLVLAGVAFWLGYTGFAAYLPDQPDFARADRFDRIYYTLQLFVLDPAPFGTGPYGTRLGIARFLAPATTILALVQTLARLFGDWIRSGWFRRARGHVIVIGDNVAATELATRLVTWQRRRPLRERLFSGTTKVVLLGSGLPPAHARRHGMLIIPGPVDVVTLQAAGVRAAGTVYAMSPVGATNAATALTVRSLSTRSIDVYARFPDNALATALQARMRAVGPDPGFRLNCFVLEDVAARFLLDRHPPEPAGDAPRPVVIAGFGAFPQAVLRELAHRDRARQGGSREVTVVTANGAAATAFAAAHQLVDAGITVRVAADLPTTSGSAMVYVGYADADAVLSAGFGRLRAGGGTTVLCLTRTADLGDALDGHRLFDNAGGRLFVFGVLDAAFGAGRIRNDLVDRLARALHAHYLTTDPSDGRAGGSRVPWKDLDPALQRDNQLAAEHIGVKLKEIGAVLMPAGPGLEPFAFQPREIPLLAEMEHERWRTAKGHRYPHPAMVAWADLPAQYVTTNEDAIRALPDVLAEAGFQIVRDRPPTPGT